MRFLAPRHTFPGAIPSPSVVTCIAWDPSPGARTPGNPSRRRPQWAFQSMRTRICIPKPKRHNGFRSAKPGGESTFHTLREATHNNANILNFFEFQPTDTFPPAPVPFIRALLRLFVQSPASLLPKYISPRPFLSRFLPPRAIHSANVILPWPLCTPPPRYPLCRRYTPRAFPPPEAPKGGGSQTASLEQTLSLTPASWPPSTSIRVCVRPMRGRDLPQPPAQFAGDNF